ncbi:hypothetical protein GLOTRDRAFT_90194 [Gloeophyllum trabeum ATCC 11539]|uniref:C2H2-type domain-containing protein n=1 Tax=Gloeophyllum trabeum (strain ATCC 11539 / FP-39264 / Madison 617) TaxID=670483 RepID=S7QMN6_GLOTA|nr:uncharacterized protein GLOTRDRAFT_90194 [Gloeophyllum trabeum ATCC 11539]EPQ60831.1 hypothetical protein GLOTRDRAFT_90194 [Gloeophyllum trabeum ATCC 11539]
MQSSSPLPSVRFILELSLRDRPASATGDSLPPPQPSSSNVKARVEVDAENTATSSSIGSVDLRRQFPACNEETGANKICGRWPSEIPSDMVSVFRADPFAFRRRMPSDGDPDSIVEMDVDPEPVSSPSLHFAATGPLPMFAHTFQLPLLDESLDQFHSVKAEDVPANHGMQVDHPMPTRPATPVNNLMKNLDEEDGSYFPADASQITHGYSVPPTPSEYVDSRICAPQQPMPTRARPFMDHGFPLESRRIYPDEPPVFNPYFGPFHHAFSDRPPQVSDWPPQAQFPRRQSGIANMSHSLVPIHVDTRRPRNDSMGHPGISPSSSLSSVSSGPSLSSCRTTPTLSPASSMSDISSYSSMSSTAVPRSSLGGPRVETQGFNLVPLPPHAAFFTDSYWRGNPSVPGPHQESRYQVDTSQARIPYADVYPETYLPHAFPVHAPRPIATDLPLYLLQQRGNSQSHVQSPNERSQKSSKSKTQAKSGPQVRTVYPCHLCPRKFNLPNGLAIHIKWHRGIAQKEKTDQPKVEGKSQSGPKDALGRDEKIAVDQSPSRRSDAAEGSLKNDPDPVMVMPPHLPRRRTTALAHSPTDSSSRGRIFPEAIDDSSACVGLGLFLPQDSGSAPFYENSAHVFLEVSLVRWVTIQDRPRVEILGLSRRYPPPRRESLVPSCLTLGLRNPQISVDKGFHSWPANVSRMTSTTRLRGVCTIEVATPSVVR